MMMKTMMLDRDLAPNKIPRIERHARNLYLVAIKSKVTTKVNRIVFKPMYYGISLLGAILLQIMVPNKYPKFVNVYLLS